MPAFTFIATVSAVVTVGAEPVFAEVDDTLTLDPVGRRREVHAAHGGGRSRCTSRTSPPTWTALGAVAAAALRSDPGGRRAGDRRRRYHDRPVGTIGAIGACSLQQTKNITTGEGGIVCTDDDDLYVRAARFSRPGRPVRHPVPRRARTRSRRAVHGRQPAHDRDRGRDRSRPARGGSPGLLAAMRMATRPHRDGGRHRSTDWQPRRIPDPDGAGGSSLTWFAARRRPRPPVVDALRAEGAPAAQMYDGRPVYDESRGARPAGRRPGSRSVSAHRRSRRAQRSPSASVRRSPPRTAIRSRPPSTRSRDSATVWCGDARRLRNLGHHARAARASSPATATARSPADIGPR